MAPEWSGTENWGMDMANEHDGAGLRVSVVIPTYNRKDSVTTAVRDLLACRDVTPHEIVVVADGCTDGTAGALRDAFPGEERLRILEQPNQGGSAARNHGAAVATGDVLLFLDDDMRPDPQLLTAHCAVLAADPGVAAVLGHIPLAAETPVTPLTRGYAQWAQARADRLAAGDTDLELGDLLAGQMAVRRTAYQAIGGFDEDFTRGGTFGGEDTDFLVRLAASGVRVVFSADAVASQDYRITPAQLLRQWGQAGPAQALLSRRHPGLGPAIAADHTDPRPAARAVKRVARLVPDAAWAPVERLVVEAASRPNAGDAALAALVVARDRRYWRGVAEAGGLATVTGPIVLAYHDVVAAGQTVPDGYAVSADQLEAHLDALAAAGYRFGDPRDLADPFALAWPDSARTVYLTFDDAFAGLPEHAVPVLTDHDAAAACFVVTGLLGAPNAWDSADRMLLDESGLGDLRGAGWLLGSHTVTHPHLTQIAPTAAYRELRRSADLINAIQPGGPLLLAYPFGDHNPVVRTLARRAGYAAAFAIGTSAWSARRDPFALARLEVGAAMTADQLVVALAGVDDGYDRRPGPASVAAEQAVAAAKATGRTLLAAARRRESD